MTICASAIAQTSTDVNLEIRNWSDRVGFTPARVLRPTMRGEVVEIIREAEDRGQSCKVLGSVWSFTPIFEASDVVIDTAQLSGLCDPRVLAAMTLRDETTRGDLAHVRGGTKIYNLNRLLHDGSAIAPVAGPGQAALHFDAYGDLPNDVSNRHALPTMGGSGGQSIAGLLATGSHGGDV